MEPLTEAGRSYRARKAQGHQKDLYLKQIQRMGAQASQGVRAVSSSSRGSHRSEGRFPRLPSTARSASTATPRAPRGTSVFRLGFGGGSSEAGEGEGVAVSDWMDAQTLDPPESLYGPSVLETEPKVAVADVSVVETELIELLSSLRRHRRDHAHVPNVDRLSACFTGMNRLIKSRTIPYAPLQDFLQLAVHEMHAAVFQPKLPDPNPEKGEEGTQPQPFFLECEHLREAELGWEEEREALNRRVADLESQLEREGEEHKEEKAKWKEEQESLSGVQDQVAFQQLQVRALRGHVTALKAQLKDLHDAMGESHERFRNVATSKGEVPEWVTLIEQSNIDLEQIIAPGVHEEAAGTGKSGWARLGGGSGHPHSPTLPTPPSSHKASPQPSPQAAQAAQAIIHRPRPPSPESHPQEEGDGEAGEAARGRISDGEAGGELEIPEDNPERRRLEEIHSHGRSNGRSPPRHHPLTRRHNGSLGLM